MPQRLLKEFWNLAPCTVAVLATYIWGAVSVSMWSTSYDLDVLAGLVLGGYVILCALAASMVFGQEFDVGILDSFLSQPVSRKRLWREKMGFLFVYLGILFCLHEILGHHIRIFEESLTRSGPSFHTTPLALAFLFFAWSSGPFFSIVTRQTHTAFWLTILSLPILSMVWHASLYLVTFSDDALRLGSASKRVTPILLWAFVAYFLRRNRFLKMELCWIGAHHNIGNPFEGSFGRFSIGNWMVAVFGRYGHLIWKEVQTQRSNLCFVLAFFLIWPAGWFASLAIPGYWGPESIRSDYVWPIYVFLRSLPFLILGVVFPALVGSHTTTYERQLEAMEWHFSLPVARLRLWVVKISVALLITALFSIMLVWLIEVYADYRLRQFEYYPSIRYDQGRPTLEMVVAIPILLFGVSLYASTLAKQPMKAFLLGLLLTGVTLFGSEWSRDVWGALGFSAVDFEIWGTRQTWLLLSLILLAWMGYTNFRVEGFRAQRFVFHTCVWIAFVFATVRLDRVLFT